MSKEELVPVRLITGRSVEVSLDEYNFLLKNKDLLFYNSYEDKEKFMDFKAYQEKMEEYGNTILPLLLKQIKKR